jgi:cyclohexanecarboxylate-CoA ligase
MPAGAEVLVDDDRRLSVAGLERRVAALAGSLRAAGVGRGDAVAWQLPNWYEAVLLYRACWRLGAVAAPVHHLAGDAEVAALIDQVAPTVVFAAHHLPAADRPGALAVRGSRDRFAGLLEGGGRPVGTSAARPADLAVALFTSGSTGAPKAALHTQRALAYKARLMAGVHGLAAPDAVLMPAPLAHISGLLNAVLLPGATGMKAVLMDRWDPERAVDLVSGEGVTFMIGPPTFFVTMQAAPGLARLQGGGPLRLISCGGAGVTPSFVAAAAEAFECTVKRTYGSTEAPTVTTSHAGDPAEQARLTDGRPTGEVELRVVDPARGRAVAPGCPGELWLRGPELFAGYADPAQTAEAITRGWFRTGDLAVVDDMGWLAIVGRLKDVIVRGGENVAATEVEQVLESHPAVRQAVAVGEPDDRLGERVAAFVVTSSPFDLAACRAWFDDAGVARFKTPERIVVVDALPVLAAGKPDRAALRARLIATR